MMISAYPVEVNDHYVEEKDLYPLKNKKAKLQWYTVVISLFYDDRWNIEEYYLEENIDKAENLYQVFIDHYSKWEISIKVNLYKQYSNYLHRVNAFIVYKESSQYLIEELKATKSVRHRKEIS